MFLSQSEEKLTNQYLNEGYVICKVADPEALELIKRQFIALIAEHLKVSKDSLSQEIMDQIHKNITSEELNSFRLKIIQGINSSPEFRHMYFKVARPYLETLVGNELAMQRRINLSIQLPNDNSSILPIHADTWSGDSPFEVVVWLPLVNCYGTKTMYLLPPKQNGEFIQNLSKGIYKNSEDLYKSISSHAQWLNVKYGEILIFNQALPHGNQINTEHETRWSMNCRFKGIFTPYGDKKIGEFFEPITLRAASRTGMSYKLPEIA